MMLVDDEIIWSYPFLYCFCTPLQCLLNKTDPVFRFFSKFTLKRKENPGYNSQFTVRYPNNNDMILKRALLDLCLRKF